MQNGMENAKHTYASVNGHLKPEILIQVLALYAEIFKDADIEFFKQRLKENPKFHIDLSYNEEKLIGFKIGYPYNSNTFYSWVGGVHSNFRYQGVASKLAQFQENYAKKEGFTKLRTKSMNQYKPMMILNLKNGFSITNIYTNSIGQTKIVFEKILG